MRTKKRLLESLIDIVGKIEKTKEGVKNDRVS